MPQTPMGKRSGYSEVVLATPRTLPQLQSCVAGPSGADVPEDTSATLFIHFAMALVVFAFALLMCLVLNRKRGGCRCQLGIPTVRLQGRDQLEEEKHFHFSLLLGSAFLIMCGVVWLLRNPLLGQLKYIEATMDTSNFDFGAASQIVETSRWRGFEIFLICAAVLSGVSLLRFLQHVRLGCASTQLEKTWTYSSWRSMAVFLLTEASAAVSMLAFCFWQEEFSNSFERQKQAASDLGFLSGAVASTASASFCMRIVLSWIGPLLINLSLSTSAILCGASFCKINGNVDPGWVVPSHSQFITINCTYFLILFVNQSISGKTNLSPLVVCLF